MPTFLFADYFIISILGLIMGSFSSYITFRLGEGQDLLFSYSKCTNCNKRLQFYNLVPLFSWYFQKGRCSNCNKKISLRYPAIELLFLVIFCAIFAANHHLMDEFLVFCLVLATIFIMMSIIDIEYYFIPMSMQLIFLLTVIIYQFFHLSQTQMMLFYGFSALVFCIFAYFLYFCFLFFAKKEAIGIDDIKLFFTIGLLLGIDKFVDFTFLCGLFGIVFGLFWQKLKKDQTFPFAPAILTSTFICFIIGERSSFLELIIIKAANILA